MKALFAWLLLGISALAANVCIREGGSGDGTAWNNALDELPATLDRNNTYYIADGTYPGYTFDDLESSGLVITIKKATIDDHGPSTGWDNSYGDGVAVFGTLLFFTDNWVFDGQVGGGYPDWTTGHGFKIANGSIQVNPPYNSTHAPNQGGDNGGDNVTLCHIEIDGGATSSSDASSEDAISCDNNNVIRLSHLYIHRSKNCPFNFFYTGDVIVEDCYVGPYVSSLEHHAEITFHYGKGNAHYRRNLFRWVQSTGGFMIHNPDAQAVRIYSNVFYRASGETWSYGGDGAIGTWSNRGDLEVRNVDVIGNTLINIPSDAAAVVGSTPHSGLRWKNNYFYSSDTGLPNGAWTADFNHYQDSGGESETNGTAGTGDPFVNFPGLNFGLNVNTSPGEDLGFPYNTDFYGNARTTRTRGAIEFGSIEASGSATATSVTATNLSIGN